MIQKPYCILKVIENGHPSEKLAEYLQRFSVYRRR